FDVRDGKFVTTFREGTVNLVYYYEAFDETGYQKIPDNYAVKEYIEAFIKYKLFEQIYNQITDETLNQVERKLQMYNQMQAEKYILADIETKKKDIYRKKHDILRDRFRNSKYEIRF